MEIGRTILKNLNEHNDYYGNEVDINNKMIKPWIDMFKEKHPDLSITKAYILIIEGGWEPSNVLLVTNDGIYKVTLPNDNDGSVASVIGLKREPEIKYVSDNLEIAMKREEIDYLN